MTILATTIEKIVTEGKGILAADESLNTIGKRFNSIKISNNVENRNNYRNILCSSPNLDKYVSGVILFEETLYQNSPQNEPIPTTLAKHNIVPGIKVDQGLTELTNFPNEKITKGLDTLADRLLQYKEVGAKFAKWRAVFNISNNTPTRTAIHANAYILARYASICQSIGYIPIVEPEVLMEGKHSIEKCADVTSHVLKEVFYQLHMHRVKLEYIILKPNMVLSGTEQPKDDPILVAEQTLKILKNCVPASVPSINFLSGGQTPIESTIHLNIMNELDRTPWRLSFSFGRALQEPCLNSWQGESSNISNAQQALLKRAKLNSAATFGKYNQNMEI